MKKSVFLAVSAVALLSGCDIGPDYLHPDTTVPAAWDGSQQTDGHGAWPAADWWTGFRSPPLDGLMTEAQKANFDIAAAQARIRQAEAQAIITAGSLWPSLQFDLGVQRARTPSTATKSGAAHGGNQYSGLFAASYELDFWGLLADQVTAAQATAQANRFDAQTTALTVQAGVANTYFAVLAARDRIVSARNNLAAADHMLEAVKARLSVGTASGLDVAQQESVVAEQRAALPPLVQALRQNSVALAILVGRLPENLPLPEGGLDSLSLPAAGPGLPAELLARRPDVQFAEARLVAANANIKAAHAALFPTVTLSPQAGLDSAAAHNLLSPAGIAYVLAASVAQPLFRGGALEGGIKLEEAMWDELLVDYRKAVTNAYGDVESALIAVEQTAQQEAADRLAAQTARRAYEITQAQLYSGTVDITIVLNTQRTLFQAEDTLVQARLAHAQAVVGLFRALGGGWKLEEGA